VARHARAGRVAITLSYMEDGGRVRPGGVRGTPGGCPDDRGAGRRPRPRPARHARAGRGARWPPGFPETRVLVLTTYDADADILRAVEAGATGYLLKDTPRERLFPAIQTAARGETVLAPTVATRLVSRMRRPAEEALTSREVEVLELVARGASNADLAAALFISEATVKTHLLHTYAKLGVDDRTAAVVAALERGIIVLPRRSS
jgi:DNA-binding CsgD family transcriptional regulator